MICQKDHRRNNEFALLPNDQGGDGRHKCAGCAYEAGLETGRWLQTFLNINFDDLDESQAGTVRHKSPHAAFALGYLRGVFEHYNESCPF